MFKRRKPDDLSGDALPAAGATGVADGPLAYHAGDAADEAVDTGLGVPPFRPALVPPNASSALFPAQVKESSMGRPPFPAAGATGPLPPAVGPRPAAAPVRPNGAGSNGMGPRDTGLSGPREMAGAMSRDAERRTLVVGRGISLQGNVQDAERLVVEGMIEATMINASELVIALGGTFKGEVQVDDAEVAGTIDGTLTVRNTLVVRASGKLLGSARCRRLQVEDGGQITGRIEMLTGPAEPAVASAVIAKPANTQPTAAEPVAHDVPSAFA